MRGNIRLISPSKLELWEDKINGQMPAKRQIFKFNSLTPNTD